MGSAISSNNNSAAVASVAKPPAQAIELAHTTNHRAGANVKLGASISRSQVNLQPGDTSQTACSFSRSRSIRPLLLSAEPHSRLRISTGADLTQRNAGIKREQVHLNANRNTTMNRLQSICRVLQSNLGWLRLHTRRPRILYL